MSSVRPKLLPAATPAISSTRKPIPKPLWPPNHWSWWTDARSVSVVGRPSSSFAHPSGIVASPRFFASSSLLPATAVVAMSKTTGGSSAAGNAYENGFVEKIGVVEPNGGTIVGPFWNASATQPASAARRV